MASAGQTLWTVVLNIAVMVGIASSVIGPGLLEAQIKRASGGPSLAQETGQFSSGGTIVWLRVDDDGAVLVFAAKGFRSAFAQPSVLTAAETDRWADALAAFVAADSAAGGRLGAGDSTMIRASFADGDVTLEEQTIGQALAIVARFGARGQTPVSAVYHSLGLRPLIPTLRQTAQLARKIENTRRAGAAAVTAVAAAPTSPAPTRGAAAPPGSAPATTPAANHATGSSPPVPAPASAAAAKPPAAVVASPNAPSPPSHQTVVATSNAPTAPAPDHPTGGPPAPAPASGAATKPPAAVATSPNPPAHEAIVATLTAPKSPPAPIPPAPVTPPTKPPVVVPVALAADSVAKVRHAKHSRTFAPDSVAKVHTVTRSLLSTPDSVAKIHTVTRSLFSAPDSVAKIHTVTRSPLSARVETPGLGTAHPANAPRDSASTQIARGLASAPDSRIEYAAPQSLSPRNGAGSDSHASARGADSTRPTPAAKGTSSKEAPPATKESKNSADPDPDSPGDSVAEKALTTGGRLPPSVLGDAIRQRQQLLQFCYTEFGLRKDPTLAGQIQVRLVIQRDGRVSEVTVRQHHWSGRGADQVESCIHDRVLHWQFPEAQRASTHEIQLIFGR
jgi:hypothetical protein